MNLYRKICVSGGRLMFIWLGYELLEKVGACHIKKVLCAHNTTQCVCWVPFFVLLMQWVLMIFVLYASATHWQSRERTKFMTNMRKACIRFVYMAAIIKSKCYSKLDRPCSATSSFRCEQGRKVWLLCRHIRQFPGVSCKLGFGNLRRSVGILCNIVIPPKLDELLDSENHDAYILIRSDLMLNFLFPLTHWFRCFT